MPIRVTNPKRYAELSKERDALDTAIRALESGAKSATISTAGNSQSVTQHDLGVLQTRRDRVNNDMLALVGGSRPFRSFYLNPT